MRVSVLVDEPFSGTLPRMVHGEIYMVKQDCLFIQHVFQATIAGFVSLLRAQIPCLLKVCLLDFVRSKPFPVMVLTKEGVGKTLKGNISQMTCM